MRTVPLRVRSQCKARGIPKDFTLFNSCCRRVRKFTESRHSASSEGEHQVSPQKSKNQDRVATDVAALHRSWDPNSQEHMPEQKVHAILFKARRLKDIYVCIIPEQIPFLPGLSAPADSLPITTVPPSPFPMPHLWPHLERRKVPYSPSLSFP